MKLVVAALLGLTQGLKFRPNPAQSPWAAVGEPAVTNAITGAFLPSEDGTDYYSRSVPNRFANGSDDLLVRSLITGFAVEALDADGAPNGNFFLTKDAAADAATEVI